MKTQDLRFVGKTSIRYKRIAHRRWGAQRETVLWGWIFICLFCSSVKALEATPFIYQGIGSRGDEKAVVEWGTAFGTREITPISERGVEQELCIDVGLMEFMAVELGGGMLLEDTKETLYSFHTEALVNLLNEHRAGINLGIALGFIRDYRYANIPRVRLMMDKSIGDFRIAFSGLLEFPIASHRDPVDIILSLASSYAIFESFQVGLEAVGEDLEGFWESDESEGGAKILGGPTIWYKPSSDITVKLNVAGVMTVSPGAVSPTSQSNKYGIEGRCVIGYRF